MPCYDSRSSPDYVRQESFEEFRHNSPVAEMLCEVMTKITASKDYNALLIANLSPDVLIWWEEHQKRDKNKL